MTSVILAEVNKVLRYVLVYVVAMQLLVACITPDTTEVPYIPPADVHEGDSQNYHEDSFEALVQEDDVLWISEHDVSVNTDFPAPSWF